MSFFPCCGRFVEIIGQLKHLCTALSMNAPSYQQETGLIHHRLHSKMADSFLSVQVSLPLRVGDRIRSIDVCFFFLMAPQDLTEDGLQRGLCDFYCIWDLYQQYLVNEQQMLNRRTALLVNYENANRNWDKAKAHKKDEVKSPSSFFWTPFTPLAAHLFLASSVVSLIVQSPPLGHRLNGISLERSSSNATV